MDDQKEIKDLKIAILRTQAELLRLQDEVGKLRRKASKNVQNTND